MERRVLTSSPSSAKSIIQHPPLPEITPVRTSTKDSLAFHQNLKRKYPMWSDKSRKELRKEEEGATPGEGDRTLP
jgi:hypothetical protein